jgi:signal transduction histidine kinase
VREKGFAGARIFIVDDEAANVRILERLLAQEGYTDLVPITDPRQVAARCEATPPDLVLLDLQMPGLSGYQVLDWIAERPDPELRPPVIVLTADVTREARERALAAGAIDFITKPFDHLEVLLRVRNLLTRRALELDLVHQNQVLEQRVRARTRELEASVEQLRRSSQQRQLLLARLVAAQEDERARIATDIHDDTVQAMVAAGIRLELVARRLTDPAQRAEMELLRATVADALTRLRTLLFELRPLTLDREGLAAALREHLERVAGPAGPAWELDDRLGREPPAEVRVTLFRIAQEAIANALRHGRPSRITLSLAEEGEGVRIAVRDDGRGFDPEQIEVAGPGHLGITAMTERASAAGGWCRVESAPGKGTLVGAWIPVREEPPLEDELPIGETADAGSTPDAAVDEQATDGSTSR